MQGSHVQMLGLGVALMFKLWRWVSARNAGEITHITCIVVGVWAERACCQCGSFLNLVPLSCLPLRKLH